MKKPVAFDAAEYLDSEEVIAEYLNVALASDHLDLFLQSLAPGAKPRYDTVLKLVRALGVELQMPPVPRNA
jgi:DNA-binding phage protein